MQRKNNFVILLDDNNSKLLLKNRIDAIDSVLLVTTKGSNGSGWCNQSLNFSLPMSSIQPSSSLECAIGEEEYDVVNSMIKFHVSELIHFKTTDNSKWVSIPIQQNGFINFTIPRVFREKNKQVTKPLFVLLFKLDDRLIKISLPFIARCRWGTSNKETEGILKRVQATRGSPFNAELIKHIDLMKETWRIEKNNTKVEKATWLQLQLLNDMSSDKTLAERVNIYCKNPKSTLDLANEIESSFKTGTVKKPDLSLIAPIITSPLFDPIPIVQPNVASPLFSFPSPPTQNDTMQKPLTLSQEIVSSTFEEALDGDLWNEINFQQLPSQISTNKRKAECLESVNTNEFEFPDQMIKEESMPLRLSGYTEQTEDLQSSPKRIKFEKLGESGEWWNLSPSRTTIDFDAFIN